MVCLCLLWWTMQMKCELDNLLATITLNYLMCLNTSIGVNLSTYYRMENKKNYNHPAVFSTI